MLVLGATPWQMVRLSAAAPALVVGLFAVPYAYQPFCTLLTLNLGRP